MFGHQFPVSDYYSQSVVNAVTLSRTGGWWSAVLVIRDPRSDKNFLNLYRWQHTEDGWKTRSRFALRSARDIDKLVTALGELRESLP